MWGKVRFDVEGMCCGVFLSRSHSSKDDHFGSEFAAGRFERCIPVSGRGRILAFALFEVLTTSQRKGARAWALLISEVDMGVFGTIRSGSNFSNGLHRQRSRPL